MLDASHFRDESVLDRLPLSHAMQLERENLLQLGSSLGRCAEKLIGLALQDVRRMLSVSTGVNGHEMAQEWAYFYGAMAPALDHTQVESKVSYCDCFCRKRLNF